MKNLTELERFQKLLLELKIFLNIALSHVDLLKKIPLILAPNYFQYKKISQLNSAQFTEVLFKNLNC